MSPQAAEYIVWGLWCVSWLLAARWATPAAGRPSVRTQWLNLTLTGLGFILLFARATRFAGASPRGLWAAPTWLAWIAVFASMGGFAFCWWARLHLGVLWTGLVSVKHDHHVVDTGPYGLVRHPIYTGILVAGLGQAIISGAGGGVLGLVLLTLGLWSKARLEEHFLRSALGAAAYDAYAVRTPMLTPWPRPARRAPQ